MIWDKAQELGRQIGQSAEYQALRRAETSLREDKDTVAKLDQIQTLARQVDQVVAQGQMPDQATAEAYETRGPRSGDESRRAGLRRRPLELREADGAGEPADQRGDGERAPPAASSRWDDAPGLLRRSGRARRGRASPRCSAHWPSGCATPGSTRSWCASRAAPGPRRSRGRRCWIRSTPSGRWPSCSSFWRPGPTWCSRHPAGARGGAGGDLGPVRAVHRGVPDGRSRARPRTWSTRPTGPRPAGFVPT